MSRLDGELVQQGRTRDLLYPVARLVAGLSRVVRLLPGDLVFTGTPAGVGLARTPPRYLRPGERLVGSVAEIGTIKQAFVSAVPAPALG